VAQVCRPINLHSNEIEFNSFDDTPWILKLVDFTKELLQQDRVRLIGVCFGHQIIGRALGMPVGRSSVGFEVSVVPLVLSSVGKQIFKHDTIVRYPRAKRF
jgi:GMP synthase-like glutamine amidotransferase